MSTEVKQGQKFLRSTNDPKVVDICARHQKKKKIYLFIIPVGCLEDGKISYTAMN